VNNKSRKGVRRPPDVGRIIDRTIVRLWDTIEELESLNPAELHFYRVAVFGSARVRDASLTSRHPRGRLCITCFRKINTSRRCCHDYINGKFDLYFETRKLLRIDGL